MRLGLCGGFMRRILVVILTKFATLAPPLAHAQNAGERAYYRGDYARSAALLIAEARAGRPTAQSFLGYQFQYGLGVPKNFNQVAYWFGRAAEQGEPSA